MPVIKPNTLDVRDGVTGQLTSDQVAAFPDGASAIDPIVIVSTLPADQLTADQVAAFPSGASAANKLVAEDFSALPTSDEKASFPSGASTANKLIAADNANLLTADQKAALPTGISALDLLVKTSALPADQLTTDQVAAFPAGVSGANLLIAADNANLLTSDQKAALPAGISALDLLVKTSALPADQLTTDQVAAFPAGASAANKLVAEDFSNLPTSDQKASFPAGAAAANLLIAADNANLLTVDQKAALPAGISALDLLVKTSALPADQLTTDQVAAFPVGASAIDPLVLASAAVSARQNLDTTHTPVALYLCADLTDSSATGSDLTATTGTPYFYSQFIRGEDAINLNGGTILTGDGDAALKLLGDMTAIVVFRQRLITGNQTLIEHWATGGAEADNLLYKIYLDAGQPVYVCQSGAGSAAQTLGLAGYPVPTHEIIMLSLVRTSNDVQFYLFDEEFGPASSGLLAPTGGANGALRIGGRVFVDEYLTGDIMCIKIIDSALPKADLTAACLRLGLPR